MEDHVADIICLALTMGRRSDDAAPPAYQRSARRAPTLGVNGSNFVETQTRAPGPGNLVYMSREASTEVRPGRYCSPRHKMCF